MHSFEFRDLPPPQDGQTARDEGFSGVVSLRGRRIEGVIGCAADACVRAGPDSVTLGVDGENWDEPAAPGCVVVCKDMISYLDVA